MRNADLGMRNEDLKERTKRFAIGIIKFVENLNRNRITYILGKQLLRSGTSVGANYRPACRAKSKADFISKISIVEEEVDETAYWIELLLEAKAVTPEQVQYLQKEANEITAIAVTSIKTARRNKK